MEKENPSPWQWERLCFTGLFLRYLCSRIACSAAEEVFARQTASYALWKCGIVYLFSATGNTHCDKDRYGPSPIQVNWGLPLPFELANRPGTSTELQQNLPLPVFSHVMMSWFGIWWARAQAVLCLPLSAELSVLRTAQGFLWNSWKSSVPEGQWGRESGKLDVMN